MKQTLNLAELVASEITFRDIVSHLREKILSCDTEFVYLNFEGVSFISRSAAHEILVIKEELPQKKTYLTNMNESVEKMFSVVQKSKNSPKANIIKFHAETIKKAQLLKLAF
jgi:anti-anti-sigma regulatory factor